MQQLIRFPRIGERIQRCIRCRRRPKTSSTIHDSFGDPLDPQIVSYNTQPVCVSLRQMSGAHPVKRLPEQSPRGIHFGGWSYSSSTSMRCRLCLMPNACRISSTWRTYACFLCRVLSLGLLEPFGPGIPGDSHVCLFPGNLQGLTPEFVGMDGACSDIHRRPFASPLTWLICPAYCPTDSNASSNVGVVAFTEWNSSPCSINFRGPGQELCKGNLENVRLLDNLQLSDESFLSSQDIDQYWPVIRVRPSHVWMVCSGTKGDGPSNMINRWGYHIRPEICNYIQMNSWKPWDWCRPPPTRLRSITSLSN